MMFKALMLENAPAFSASVQSVDEARLLAGDVTVAVAYSTLNYKEGLAITNKIPVVRQWPMVARVDGMLMPAQVAGDVDTAMHDETFLVLPHPEVLEYFRRKAQDYDRWLGGMQKVYAKQVLGQ